MNYLEFPDFEAIANKSLRDGGYRVYSSVPSNPEWPLMVVHRAGGFSPVRRYLDAARIQVDVWGGAKGDSEPVPKSTIHDMAAHARVLLLELEGTTINDPVDAFISAVDDAQSLMWLPDDSTGRDRYLFQVLIFGRTLYEVSS